MPTKLVDKCQSCGSDNLDLILSLGDMPLVNDLVPIGTRQTHATRYPTDLLACDTCGLVQLGVIVDPAVVFPASYPYTSGTTRALRENFAELANECFNLLSLERANECEADNDLVLDIGSNDGTLLEQFFIRGCRVHGVEPTDVCHACQFAVSNCPFTAEKAEAIEVVVGKAALVTACNVFAHVADPHDFLEGVLRILEPSGVFVSESHYFCDLVDGLQYDVIYHEHLRYYTLSSLMRLLEAHGLEVFRAKRIPTHGGSIRAYAARKGTRKIDDSVPTLTEQMPRLTSFGATCFRQHVLTSKANLWRLPVRWGGERVFGIAAPSRSTILTNYIGLDGVLDCVCEVEGSKKIGHYVPGTRIPIVTESRLFDEQPEYALILAWHIADELASSLRRKGYRGRFIVPLPEPRILSI